MEAVRVTSAESLWRAAVPNMNAEDVLPSLRYAAELTVVPEPPDSPASRRLVIAGVRRHLIGLDSTTGKPLWPPHDFGVALGRPTRFVDLDGDQRPEVLAVLHPDGGDWQLTAISLSDRRPRWTAPVNWFPNAEWPRAVWPDVVDLDDDGRVEVLLPNNVSRAGTYGAGVRVFDGATGQQQWSRWFPYSPHQRLRTQTKPERYAVGPDLDGDGVRELFVASIRSEIRPRLAREGYSHHYEEYLLYVDCFSGRDGRSLWWQRVPLGLTEFAALTGDIGELLWWGNGIPLGEPNQARLVIPVNRHPDTQQDGGTHSIYVLNAATGRIEHQADDVAFPQLVDWNNDGLDDLAVFVPDDPVRFENRHQWPDTPTGKFVVLRGSPPEAFRRLDHWVEEQDFDGDGGEELLRFVDNKLTASRGLHDVLWSWTRPASDYDGWVSRFDRAPDGRAIVVTSSGDSLTLLDGPTGKPLGRTFTSTNTSLQENNRTVDLNHAVIAKPFENSRLLTRVGDGHPMFDHVVSRTVLPADAEGKYASRLGTPARPEMEATSEAQHRTGQSARPTTRSKSDPRLMRQLPWAPSQAEWAAGQGMMLKQVGLAVGLSFVVWLIPFWLIRAGVRRKELGWWRTALIVAGMAGCATSLIVFRLAPPGAVWRDVPFLLPLEIGAAALPGLVWIATLVQNLIAGEWRRLSWLLGGSLVAAAGLAALILSLTASQKPPEQHYSWHAWWFILLFGAHAVGALLVVWKLLGPGVLWLWRRFKQRQTPSSLTE